MGLAALTVPNYVASEDHLAYRNGGLVTAAREFVPNQKVQHSSDAMITSSTKGSAQSRTGSSRFSSIRFKSRIAVGNPHGHHLPLERSKWGAHGCAGKGLFGERHLMTTMSQVNHSEDPSPVLLLQHVLFEGQRIAVVLRLGV